MKKDFIGSQLTRAKHGQLSINNAKQRKNATERN